MSDLPSPGSVQREAPVDPYPEHTRQHAILPQSQAIGEFLEWLQQEHGYSICEWQERTEEDEDHAYSPAAYYPLHRSIESWLAQYFQIDPVKIELEKRAMLDAQRALNAQWDAEREAAK